MSEKYVHFEKSQIVTILGIHIELWLFKKDFYRDVEENAQHRSLNPVTAVQSISLS